jgi:hypothetical protein
VKSSKKTQTDDERVQLNKTGSIKQKEMYGSRNSHDRPASPLILAPVNDAESRRRAWSAKENTATQNNNNSNAGPLMSIHELSTNGNGGNNGHFINNNNNNGGGGDDGDTREQMRAMMSMMNELRHMVADEKEITRSLDRELCLLSDRQTRDVAAQDALYERINALEGEVRCCATRTRTSPTTAAAGTRWRKTK